ncbi:hypothetical protein C2E25_00910 [Geothermobacter hydrogeniphilus]|uniref:DUF4136 domain-containing protein n=2 Tax=Geothermobacter hydrogeniphilus TaxID=1969733 RepID=A0A2K2HEX5_9BACT|nr:hypothetical protein C2E25_00910 [Geothermobacter hydrogeniphilus]
MKYSFLPLAGQKGNLEYKSYKKIVADKLAAYGFVEDQENPEYFIAFAYGIDNGKEEISSVPIFGQTGVSSSTTYGSINTYGSYGSYSGTTTYQPTYGVVGSAPVSSTVYTRKLELSIIDIQNSKPDEPSVVYQADVVSSGSSSQIAAVMPYMLEALFKKFPDESGKTRRETIPMK